MTQAIRATIVTKSGSGIFHAGSHVKMKVGCSLRASALILDTTPSASMKWYIDTDGNCHGLFALKGVGRLEPRGIAVDETADHAQREIPSRGVYPRC